MTETMITTSNRYFEALSDLDRQAYIACFSDEAELIDPYGGRPFHGREGLSKWFTGMERTWAKFSMKPINHYVSGDRVAVHWQASGESLAGKTATFAGINVFTIGEHGAITRLEGYWDAASMMDQIS